MMRGYPIDLNQDEDGSFLATCPVMPEITTFGDSASNALLHAVGAVEEGIAARISDWQDVPAPRQPRKSDKGFAPLPMQTLLKVELYRLVKSNGVTRAGFAGDCQSEPGAQAEMYGFALGGGWAHDRGVHDAEGLAR